MVKSEWWNPQTSLRICEQQKTLGEELKMNCVAWKCLSEVTGCPYSPRALTVIFSKHCTQFYLCSFLWHQCKFSRQHTKSDSTNGLMQKIHRALFPNPWQLLQWSLVSTGIGLPDEAVTAFCSSCEMEWLSWTSQLSQTLSQWRQQGLSNLLVMIPFLWHAKCQDTFLSSFTEGRKILVIAFYF